MKRSPTSIHRSALGLHPESLPLLALIISAVALVGIFAIWMQVIEMHKSVAKLEATSNHTRMNTAFVSKQVKRLTSVRPGTEPVNFLVDDLAVTVTKDVAPANFVATELKSAAAGCNVKHPDGYFTRVADTLRGATQAVYTFRYDYNGEYTGGRAILLQNKLKYKDINGVRQDFPGCGSTPRPVSVNKDWVLFLMPCLPADDYQNRAYNEQACQEVTQALASVRLK
jgi:hypothetical protein